MHGCRMPKQRFIAITGNYKLSTIVLSCVSSMKLNIGKNITGLEMMPWMIECFQTYRMIFKGGYTVFRDTLESRHVERTLKLVNPKHED